MFAYTRLVEGLLVSHVMIATAYLIGANVTTWDRREAASAADAMVRLVCTAALGFALLGFGAFLIAVVGALNPTAGALMVVALFAAGCVVARSSPFRASYWRDRWGRVAAACDVPHVVIYFAMLVVAFPAINLVNVGADALAFHWAYAIDFIHAGALTVDPFLRETFYAQNDLMLVALVMLFGGAVFNQFVMWSLGLLTAWGVCAAVRAGFAERGPWTDVIGVLLAIAAVYSPTYLRWMDSGYLDVALGFFALAAVLALARGLRGDAPDWRWLWVSAVIAAFLIGSKTSLLPFIFVFAIALALAARRLGCTRGQIAAIVAVLAILSAPWYVRNLVLAGDPISPWLNLSLHGSDGLVTRTEWAGVADDLNTAKGPIALLTVPLRLFLTPDTLPFREFAENALVLLLFVPTAVAFVLFFVAGRRLPPTVLYPIGILTTLIGYWLFTSTFARYSLLFTPLLAVCCGLVVGAIRAPIKRLGPVFAVIFALCLVISPTAEARQFYSAYFINGVQNPPQYYTADDPFLRQLVDGYAEEQFATRAIHRLRIPGRLYLLGTNLAYYYRRDGVESIGDWIGPAGTLRLYHAVDTGQTTQFVNALDVNAVLLDPNVTQGGLQIPIERSLVRGGFCRIPLPDSRMSFFVRTAASCAQAARIAAR